MVARGQGTHDEPGRGEFVFREISCPIGESRGFRRHFPIPPVGNACRKTGAVHGACGPYVVSYGKNFDNVI